MAIQVIRAPQRQPSTSERFAEVIGNSLGQVGGAVAKGYGQRLRQKEEQDLLKQREQGEIDFLNRKYGEDLTGSTPKQREIYLSEKLKGENRAPQKDESRQEIASLNSALDTINRMRDIGKKGNLGFGLGVRELYSPDARREAGEYEQLGKSLIQFASNIKITNRREFEVLAHKLYDPSITDDEREGILSALEKRIMGSINQYGAIEPSITQNQERPPLSAFRK